MNAAVALSWCLALGSSAVAAAAVSALRRRAELVARARHELAGPLQAAGLALHAARAEAAPAPRLAAIDAELRRAARALDDLDAARAGRRARDAVRVVDVGCLAAGQALVWQVVAREHGRTLRVVAASGALVRADPGRLAQAVGNLLANALEHGAGRVELCVRADGDAVRIEVRDEGAGPDASALARRPRAGRGARGRGLAIVAGIASAYGGRLHAVAGDPCVGIELPVAGCPRDAPRSQGRLVGWRAGGVRALVPATRGRGVE